MADRFEAREAPRRERRQEAVRERGEVERRPAHVLRVPLEESGAALFTTATELAAIIRDRSFRDDPDRRLAWLIAVAIRLATSRAMSA